MTGSGRHTAAKRGHTVSQGWQGSLVLEPDTHHTGEDKGFSSHSWRAQEESPFLRGTMLLIQAFSWGRVLLPFEKATNLCFYRQHQNPSSHLEHVEPSFPPQMTFSAGRKQGSCTIYLGKGQDHCSLEAGGVILVIFFSLPTIPAARPQQTSPEVLYLLTKTYLFLQKYIHLLPALETAEHTPA